MVQLLKSRVPLKTEISARLFMPLAQLQNGLLHHRLGGHSPRRRHYANKRRRVPKRDASAPT